MPEENAESYSQRELIQVFAQDKADEAQRREVEALLEQNEQCREYFRGLTAGRYPRLPNYTIIGQIGKGGFGVVYKAVHHAKERIEALKVLFSQTPLLTEYFQNEVHLIARLQHSNIATLYDAQLATPPLYYTMEYVDGERLNDYLKRSDVSLAERIKLIQSVANAVGYAHRQGVVHRDLKPQNMLIDKDGQACVVDFGISVKLAEAGAPTAPDAKPAGHEGPVGTLGYIAPEQEAGKPVAAGADIFALGALLFHCITGEPARLANVEDQRIRILRERKIAQPYDLDAIIGRCMEEQPESRYATCEDFIDDLGNYLSGRTIQARGAPSIPYKMMRIGAVVLRDSPRTVQMAVAVLVVAFLTALFWHMETNTRDMPRPGQLSDQTVMIGFSETTQDAVMEGRIGADLPDLNAFHPRSWRMLYGRLLERLATASPYVVLIDSYMVECSEGYESHFDQILIDGFRAMKAPVLVAAEKFDLNGEPLICEKFRDEIEGCGAIINGDPRKHRNQFEVTHCIKRGRGLPIPGLALAAYAAAEHPDCIPELVLDSDNLELSINYRKRDPVPGEANYLDFTEHIALINVDSHDSKKPAFSTHIAGLLDDGDELGNALLGAQPNSFWKSDDRTLYFEDVLTASDEQLRGWFSNKAIVIGQMIGKNDLKERKSGEMMYGCQLHAEAINNLLASRNYRRFHPWELWTRNALWCALAVVVVNLAQKKQWQSLQWASLTCAAILFTGITLSGHAAMSAMSDRPRVELLIALSGMLTTGSLAYIAKAVRERLHSLLPSSAGMTTEVPTLDSTMLAETR